MNKSSNNHLLLARVSFIFPCGIKTTDANLSCQRTLRLPTGKRMAPTLRLRRNMSNKTEHAKSAALQTEKNKRKQTKQNIFIIE